MGARRDDLMDTTMVRMPDGSYLPAADLRNMNAMQLGEIYKARGGFGSTLDTGTGIQSAQEMFNQTYEEAMANEYLANILEGQGVPDVVPFSIEGALQPVNVADGINEFETNYVKGLLDQGLVTVADVAQQTGIPESEIQKSYNLLSGIDPDTEEKVRQELSDFLASQETTNYEDPNARTTDSDILDTQIYDEEAQATAKAAMESEWEKTDKDRELGAVIQSALDIFGLGNIQDGIRKVADVVNQRGASVYDVAQATGNTVEYINTEFEKAGVKINNQQTPETKDTTPTDNGALQNDGAGTPTEVVGGRVIGEGVTAPAPPDVDDRPQQPQILPTLPKVTPEQKTTNLGLMQAIVNDTSITKSILFEPQMREIDNVQQGMFEAFMRAAGGIV